MRYLYASLAAAMFAATAVPAVAGTLLVPRQFSTIQAALNAAKPYDTVLVSAKPKGGVYAEAVTLSTPHVVLQGVGSPVLDGSTLGKVIHVLPGYPEYDYTQFPNGIEVQADHIAVRGMTVQNFATARQGLTSAGINVGSYVRTGDFSGGEVSYSDIEVSGNTLQKNNSGLLIAGFTGGNPLSSNNGAYLSGYRVLGNLFTANNAGGAALSGKAILVSGNRFISNQFSGTSNDGLDVTGVGLSVFGNESASNAGAGININTPNYAPAVSDPKNPNPAASAIFGNSVHDNGMYGLQISGTVTVSANQVNRNTGYGIYLNYADYSTISGNSVSGTALGGYVDDGTGIYSDYSTSAYYGTDSGLKVSFNQVSGNAGDGISFSEVSGGVISFNSVTGNQGIGVHLSDFNSYNAYSYPSAPTTVTRNLAQHNIFVDARDDASAPNGITVNYDYYNGDGGATVNIWTKNLFGTTDPVGLSK